MKNRYFGRIKISYQGETFDTADVKTKVKKGKTFFLNEVSKTIVELSKAVIAEQKRGFVANGLNIAASGPEISLDVFYEGDFGEELNAAMVASGGKSLGTIKGHLGAV